MFFKNVSNSENMITNIFQSFWAYFKANSPYSILLINEGVNRNFSVNSAKYQIWYKKVLKFRIKSVGLILI